MVHKNLEMLYIIMTSVTVRIRIRDKQFSGTLGALEKAWERALAIFLLKDRAGWLGKYRYGTVSQTWIRIQLRRKDAGNLIKN